MDLSVKPRETFSMENKALIRRIFVFLFVGFSLGMAISFPQILGIAIFALFVMLGAFQSADKRKALNQQVPQAAILKQPSLQGHEYSRQYSLNKTEDHNSVNDKPLSEAERNVVYGK